MSEKLKYKVLEHKRYPIAVGIPPELEPFRKNVIYFCIPTRGDDIYWGQVTFLLRQFAIFRNASLFYGVNGHVCAIENMLQGLTKRGFDYAWFMDADIGPDTLTPLRLIARQKDVVHAPVWMYDPNQNDIHLNSHTERDGELLPRKHIAPQHGGIQKIVSASMASCLISRPVIQAFADNDEPFTRWTPFLSKDFKNMPADVIFWAKVEKFGFEQYIDWDAGYSVHHRLVELCPDSMEYFSYARAIEFEKTMPPEMKEKLDFVRS